MDQDTQTIERPRQDLEITPRDIEILAYIHANKFITTKLFHKKFLPDMSYQTACRRLNDLERAGLILRTQTFNNADCFYYLSRPSLHQLYSLARILISHEVRSPHINTFEREHDKRVLEMRIQIESDPSLQDMVWLSDHEMKRGLRMDWKKLLEKGLGFGLEKVKLHRCYRRTPDGYFETVIQGTPYTFVLEYEHTPYNREKMVAMVLNLTRDFPGAYRLIVSRDLPHATRMVEGLSEYLKGDPQSLGLWAFSFYEKVSTLPFTRVTWATLEGKYPPFVTDPIRSTGAKAPEKAEVES